MLLTSYGVQVNKWILFYIILNSPHWPMITSSKLTTGDKGKCVPSQP